MSRWIHKSETKAGLIPGAFIYTGQARQEKVHITLMNYNEATLTEECLLDFDLFKDICGPNTISWIDFDGIHNIDQIRKVGDSFQLHSLLTEDILNNQQRPKIEEYENHLFCIIKMIQWDENNLACHTEQVALVLGSGFLLSFQEKPGDCLDGIRKRIRESKGRIRKLGADYLMYALLDSIVDHYFVVMEKVGNQIEELEDEMILNPSQKSLDKLNAFKKEIINIRKSIYPFREALHLLISSENEMIQNSTEPFLRDLYDHTFQIIDVVDSYKELLNHLYDIYMSSMSQKMNEIMKVLTIYAAIFIPLTFIAGVYGMNFEHMPELKWPYGYYSLLGIMVCIGTGMLAWFKKKKWL